MPQVRDPAPVLYAVHYHAVACLPFPADPRASWLGLDPAGYYIGECSRATAKWQTAHALCGHGIRDGAWWVMIGLGKQKPYQVRNGYKARCELLAAGATRLEELYLRRSPPKPSASDALLTQTCDVGLQPNWWE
jgi:hypothetical protein